MKALQIAVVENNVEDRIWLEEKLAKYCSVRHINYVLQLFPNGESFVAALKESWFDVVFMDIYLDKINGVEAAMELRAKDKNCKLVFLTVSSEFMPQGFALNSAHYLVKPVKDKDFLQAMENCSIKRKCQVPFLEVTAGKHTVRISTLDILYIEVENRIATIHTKTNTFPIGRSFRSTAVLLQEDERFMLCNKGIMVNMDFIASMEECCFVLVNGEKLPIAPRRKKELYTKYCNYTFGSLEE